MSKTIEYNGSNLVVRGGAWCDEMNSCQFTIIDKIEGYDICRENKWDKNSNLIGPLFAIENRYSTSAA